MKRTRQFKDGECLESLYRAAFEQSADGILFFDENGEIVEFNRAAHERLGYSREEFSNFRAGSDDTVTPAEIRASIENVLEEMRTEFEARHRRKNGEVLSIKIIAGKIIVGDRKFFHSIWREMGQDGQAAEALEGNLCHSIIDSADDSIYLVDKNYQYLFLNRKHLVRLGILGKDFRGRSYADFHSPAETREFIRKIDCVFRTGKSVQQEHKSLRDNESYLRTMSPVKGRNGATVAVAVISKNITLLKRLQDELRTLSLTDDLTGLYNRRGFFVLAEKQLKLSARLKKGVLLITADLDDLKKINDKYGHQEGDSALIEIGNMLKETYRESDIIARMGGDEFAILLLDSTPNDGQAMSGRLRRSLELRNAAPNRTYRLSVSIGVSCSLPGSNSCIDDLLARADKLMYHQKRLRKNSN